MTREQKLEAALRRALRFVANSVVTHESNTLLKEINEAITAPYTSKDDAEQFKIASHLLVQWLADRPNPHMTAIVTGSGAELLTGYCTANQRLP